MQRCIMTFPTTNSFFVFFFSFYTSHFKNNFEFVEQSSAWVCLNIFLVWTQDMHFSGLLQQYASHDVNLPQYWHFQLGSLRMQSTRLLQSKVTIFLLIIKIFTFKQLCKCQQSVFCQIYPLDSASSDLLESVVTVTVVKWLFSNLSFLLLLGLLAGVL